MRKVKFKKRAIFSVALIVIFCLTMMMESSVMAQDPAPAPQDAPTLATVEDLAIDMVPNTEAKDDSITYTLSMDGSGWPYSDQTTNQIVVSGTMTKGSSITVTIPFGIKVISYDQPGGISVTRTQNQNKDTILTYTSERNTATVSFNVSYRFAIFNQYNDVYPPIDGIQYAPGITVLPVKVSTVGNNITGNIIVDNPITPTFSIDSKRMQNIKDGIFTADGHSTYRFIFPVKTVPEHKGPGVSIALAPHSHMSGRIQVPPGFVLQGAEIAKYWGTLTTTVMMEQRFHLYRQGFRSQEVQAQMLL